MPRFWPSFSGLGATMRGMRFDWRRVVRKEYGATFSWLTTFLGVILWEHFARDGYAGVARVARPVGDRVGDRDRGLRHRAVPQEDRPPASPGREAGKLGAESGSPMRDPSTRARARLHPYGHLQPSSTLQPPRAFLRCVGL